MIDGGSLPINNLLPPKTQKKMTKTRRGDISQKSKKRRARSPPGLEPDQIQEIPGFGGGSEEEGVPSYSDFLESDGVLTDTPPPEEPLQRKRVIPGLKARALKVIRSARAELAAAAEENARLKEALAVKVPEPDIQPGAGARRVFYDQTTSQPTEAEKDANRRALLAKCSEGFRKLDLTKVQSIPSPFSGGQGQDLDEFLVRFEVRANNCGWTEQDKVLGLAYHLDKGAALAYQRMIANGELASATFNDAVAYLRAKYPQASPSGDQLVTIFRNLRQRKGESVAEFAERFQSALVRAERFQGPMSAAAVITRFRASLRDSLRAQLRQVKLESLGAQPLNGMIAEAIHMETLLLQEGNYSDGESDDAPATKRKRVNREDDLDELDPRPQTAKRVVRAVATEDEPWRPAHPTALRTETTPPPPTQEDISQVLRQVKAVVETTQAVAARMHETQARAEADDRTKQARAEPQTDYRRRDSTAICFKCGKPGHRALECRNTRYDRDDRHGRNGDRRDQQRQPYPYRGGNNRYVPYRPPQRYDDHRYQGDREQRRPPDDRDHRRDPPRDSPRDRQAAEPRQPRPLADEDRRILQRSAEIIQGALQAAMAPAPTQNPQRPN